LLPAVVVDRQDVSLARGDQDTSRPAVESRYEHESPPKPKAHTESGIRNRDEVDCSVFAPTVIRSGNEALVQIFLHVPEQAVAVLGIATAADPLVDRQITQALAMPARSGFAIPLSTKNRGFCYDTSENFALLF
jgi:hypothetical protein